LKKYHLLRSAHPSSVNVLRMYASLLRISRALHLALFERPAPMDFFNNLLGAERPFYGASIQFSSKSPGTRSNSLRLFVTRVSPCARAWPAIIMSWGPMGRPAE